MNDIGMTPYIAFSHDGETCLSFPGGNPVRSVKSVKSFFLLGKRSYFHLAHVLLNRTQLDRVCLQSNHPYNLMELI